MRVSATTPNRTVWTAAPEALPPRRGHQHAAAAARLGAIIYLERANLFWFKRAAAKVRTSVDAFTW